MRNELEEIQRIEKYLLKELNPTELIAFEEELKNNISLQEKVNQQKILLKGIRKKAFKVLAKSTFKKYKLIKKMWWGGIALSIVATAITATLTFANKEEKKTINTITPMAIPKVDSTEVDTVSLTPSTMPMIQEIAPEKPRIQKSKEVKKDSVAKENIINPKGENKTTKSLIIDQEGTQDFIITK
ncbi:MAG: hypothetical protein ACO3E1_06500 [Flavobacteriales bacterium]